MRERGARTIPAAPDGELVGAAVAGGEAAFAALYARYADRVFARLTLLIGPRADREDLVQQVFLRLHCALPRFRGDSSLPTFLYRITLHVAFDHLRHRGRRPVVDDPEALDAMVDGDPTPEDRIRRRQELRQVFALLEQIAPNKRRAFELVAVNGMSLRDAADLVDSNAEAVKQRVLHARHELVALIKAVDARDARASRRRSARRLAGTSPCHAPRSAWPAGAI